MTTFADEPLEEQIARSGARTYAASRVFTAPTRRSSRDICAISWRRSPRPA